MSDQKNNRTYEPKWPRSWFPPPKSHLGADYDTTWARKTPARLVRAAMINFVTRPFIHVFATPSVVGIDRLDDLEGPAIFVANHSSHIDTSLMMTVLPDRFRRKIAIAARHDYIFDKWWKATIWALWYNVVPIERNKASRRSVELPQTLMRNGWSFALYPEESRGPNDFMLPFKPGAAYLAIKAGVPVVPMHFTGTRSVFSPYSRRFKPGKTRVVFGEPLYALTNERPGAFNKRIQHAVEQAADEGRTNWWDAKLRAAKGETPSLLAPDGLVGWRQTWESSTTADTVGEWNP
jgi:1-acyl-sn-glycerol-3-phosphate acyltransferase